MDFGSLLAAAQKNKNNKKSVAKPCYQTKFAPPKKQIKQSKALSDNIKKFLARKEEEERQKTLEEKKKKENLLALRDRKTQNRINKHLKVCKSANKSVLEDAIDNENTAITMAGPSQPDEDDYGYVSQAASAFHIQLMNKYNNLPSEKSIFSDSGKRTIKDIASTKDRVKQALKQQELDGIPGHRRKRKSSALTIKEIEVDEKGDKNIVDQIKDESKDKTPKAKKKLLPPPMDFGELLKLAEKKQHEPIVVEVKPKAEEVRLMTKREMREYMKEKEWRERKEQRDKHLETNKKMNITDASNKPNKLQLNKIPKTNEKSLAVTSTSNENSSKAIISKKITNKLDYKCNIDKDKPNLNENTTKDALLEERKKLEAERKQLEQMRRAIEEEKRKLSQNTNKQEDIKSQVKSSNKIITKSRTMDKQISSKDIKLQESASANLKSRSSLINEKPKILPSSNIRPIKSKQVIKKGFTSNKRRIYDDEDEYDPDLKDFIDDGPEENTEDYSRYISEIFGYDKSKYRNVDDEDDVAMESNFAQQLKEEYVSTKIGIMEDLEDIRKEASEKKRKALLKKARK